MRARMVFAVALAFAVLGSVAPVAHAGTGGAFRRVERPRSDQVAALLGPSAPTTRGDVFNGAFVARGEHPYVGLVVLLNPETGKVEGECSGSLIRPRYVLTAGHCTKRARAAVFIPKVVDLRVARPRDVFVVRAVATAPRYSPRTLRDDVGLLQLSRPAKIRTVPVAAVADDQRFAGATATVVGWGAVDRGLKAPNRLRRGSIELLSNDRCLARWGQVFRPGSMICGGSRVTGACVGDSGGPLLVRDGRHRWLLLGTTSFGRSACAPGPDGVYARVSSVRTWIERMTGIPLLSFLLVLRPLVNFGGFAPLGGTGVAQGTPSRRRPAAVAAAARTTTTNGALRQASSPPTATPAGRATPANS